MNKSIIIADDHPISLRGMESVVIRLGYNVVGSFDNGLHALNKIYSAKPDYALLDVQMPGMCGLDIVEQMQPKKLKTKTIIYTMYNDLALFERAKKLEVNGYLLKEFAIDELKLCLESLERGENWYSPNLEEKLLGSKPSFAPELYCKLTSAEKAIVKSIANKKSSQEIADDNFMSIKTVENHRTNIIKKLELPREKNVLLIWALENKGFFPLVD